MGRSKFGKWHKWTNRNSIKNVKFPGVYCVAISVKNLENKPFKYKDRIEYIGMTISKTGLKGRLAQFNRTLKGGRGHSGAKTMRKVHAYRKVLPNLYVAIRPFVFNVKEITPSNLRKMGDVVKYEFSCFAKYALKNNHKLPRFNTLKSNEQA